MKPPECLEHFLNTFFLRYGMKDYEIALKDLNKLKEMEPDDKSVINELTKVKKAFTNYNNEQKKKYAKMFK